MTKKILAVLDPDQTYVTRFMEYSSQMKGYPFVVRAFTDQAVFSTFLETHPVDILLLSDLIKLESAPQVGLIVRLSEFRSDDVESSLPGTDLLKDTEPGKKPLKPDFPVIFKYQSSAVVLRRLEQLYKEETGTNPSPASGPGTDILGIISPVGRSGKTTFALTLGECLAMKKPTLLISLESCSGWQETFHETWTRDLSDGICCLRSAEPPVTPLMDAVRKIGELSYIPPFSMASNLFSVSTQEWLRLFDVISGSMPFEAVVVDFGDLVWKDPMLLTPCRHIYMPVLTDPVAEAKVREFQRQMQNLQDDGTIAKPEPVSVMDQKIPSRSDRRTELLPYSGLGAYTRGLISRDRL